MKKYPKCFVCDKPVKDGFQFFEPNENLDGSYSCGYWRPCHIECKHKELNRREAGRKEMLADE